MLECTEVKIDERLNDLIDACETAEEAEKEVDFRPGHPRYEEGAQPSG